MYSYFTELLVPSPRAILAVDIVIKATLVLAAAGAVALALRRSSAAARHLAWCVGLGAAVGLPVLAIALPAWSWRVMPAAPESDPLVRSSPDSLAPGLDRPSTARHSLLGVAPEEEEAPLTSGSTVGLAPASSASGPTPSSLLFRSVLTPSWWWLWTAWLAGAVAVVSAPIVGRFALQLWARAAEPIVGDDWIALLDDLSTRLGLTRPVTLLRSERSAMPMTWGWIRPVVLLPAEALSWTIDRRRDVLLHELAHVRRLDCVTQTIARVACAVYWFHPLAWIAERRMRIERERACDDVVLLAGARASDYAGHLLEIARGLRVPRTAALAALAMARPSQLEGRLLAILDPDRTRRGPGRRRALIALITAMLMLVPLAALHLGVRASATAAPALEPIVENAPPADPAARMTLTGRVLDPAGKPVSDAAVMVIVRPKYSARPWMEQAVMSVTTPYNGRCDGSGQFHVEVPRTTSARHYGLFITAMASGFGAGWTEVDPDADPPVADVVLRPELIVRGRMFDVKGQPAPGVALRIESLDPVVGGTLSFPIWRPDGNDFRRRDFPAWPGPAISDQQGRFTLRGLSRDLVCRLLVEDPRFALPNTWMQTAENIAAGQPIALVGAIKVDPGPDPKPIVIALQPAQTIIGRVTFADTGRPVPHAVVSTGPYHFEADADGRYRVPTWSGRTNRFGVRAQSPDGAPYLLAMKQGEWPKGAVEQSADVALPRGVVVHGKVTEEGTGRPVAGAVVRVTPHPGPPGPPPSFPTTTVSGPDGAYRVAAPPGPGYVVAQGPDDDYVLHEFGAEGGMYQAQPGRRRFYAHAYRPIDLEPGGPDHEVDLSVRRGVALRGRAVGPDGQPVRDGWVCSRLMLRTEPDGGWKLLVTLHDHSRSRLRDGRFILHGLDPNSADEVPAFFLEPERKLGATVRFSGRSADNGPVTVRLEPCGTAKLRLVTSDGKPLDRYTVLRSLVSMVVAPGPLRVRNQANDGPLLAAEAGVQQLDPVNYKNDLQSDAEGRLTLPALIPDATYRIQDFSPLFAGGDTVIRKEFTVKPGETLDLGDVVIARPQGRN
jgi:beta-lactamase regulating signal transducer with metallopeptidase domain